MPMQSCLQQGWLSIRANSIRVRSCCQAGGEARQVAHDCCSEELLIQICQSSHAACGFRRKQETNPAKPPKRPCELLEWQQSGGGGRSGSRRGSASGAAGGASAAVLTSGLCRGCVKRHSAQSERKREPLGGRRHPGAHAPAQACWQEPRSPRACCQCTRTAPGADRSELAKPTSTLSLFFNHDLPC